MIRYLTCDHIGHASRIEYGKKGDQVTVISISGGIALVDGGKELYHIRAEKLSDKKPVENEKPEAPKVIISAPLKRKTKTSRPPKQNKLF